MCGTFGVLAWLAVAPMSGDAAGEKGAWNFHVEPAVRMGVPTILGSTTESSESLVMTVSELEGATSRTIITRSMPSGQVARFELPTVSRNTHVDVSITTGASLENPVFRWRTLLIPRGKRLFDYRGARGFKAPADFDAYWEAAKRELSRVPMDAKITRVPDRDTSTGLLHRVELQTVGDTRIVCWYYVPRTALDTEGRVLRRCPAVVIMPGYGAEEPPLDRTSSDTITLSVNPRNHGPSREYWKSPVDHLLYNIADPGSFYYRQAFLDCLRAAEFVFSRPEVDAARVGSEGGSQGGLFAIALAALEPRIACVCSNVTAFSGYADSTILARTGHHRAYRELLAAGGTTATLARKSLAYTDGANMAARVRCPLQINMGGQDPVCPFVAGIVVYHRVPKGAPKEFHVLPDIVHAVPPEMRALNADWYRRWLKIP